MRRSLAMLMVVLGLLATACSDGGDTGDPQPTETDSAAPTEAEETEAPDDDATEDADGELTEVSVSYIPVTNPAPLFVGIEQGFFEEEGLSLQTQEIPPQSTIPAAVSGEVDISFTNPPAAVLARSNGLPIKVIAPLAKYSEDPDNCILHVVTAGDSDIQDATDLEGKRLSLDALFQLPHLSILQAAKDQGADPSLFDIVEVPFPAQIEALQAGQVDAITLGEPFLTIAERQGMRRVLSLCQGWPENSSAAMWIASEEFIASNDETVDAFNRAMIRSAEYAQENPDSMRAVIPQFTPVEQELADVIILPEAATELNRETFQIYYDLLEESDNLGDPFEIADLFLE